MGTSKKTSGSKAKTTVKSLKPKAGSKKAKGTEAVKGGKPAYY